MQGETTTDKENKGRNLKVCLIVAQFLPSILTNVPENPLLLELRLEKLNQV